MLGRHATPSPRRRVPLAALLGLALAAPLAAHDLRLTDTLLLVRADGTFQVDMLCDLDALALGAGPDADAEALVARLRALPPEALADKVEALRRSFARRVRVLFDGRTVATVVSFPERGTALAGGRQPPTFFGLRARLEGRIPPAAQELTFRASRAFPPLALTILDQATLGGRRELLERGGTSTPYRLGTAAAEEPQTLPAAFSYLRLGFLHIVPRGADHVLFVLGLFLLAARLRPLLIQVTAFTAAHTVTLALSTYGVVSLPPRLVEPAIALSIVWVGVENSLTRRLTAWRPVGVFACGLLHGLGFAGVLSTLGLPAGERVAALVSFNAGVELGQLTVLGAAFLAVGRLRHRSWYRSRLAVPASLALAAVALVWTVQRLLA